MLLAVNAFSVFFPIKLNIGMRQSVPLFLSAVRNSLSKFRGFPTLKSAAKNSAEKRLVFFIEKWYNGISLWINRRFSHDNRKHIAGL
jgi:DNA phosphorothioation-dependent restriction protein DptG